MLVITRSWKWKWILQPVLHVPRLVSSLTTGTPPHIKAPAVLLSLAESLRESLQDYTSSSINNTQDREKYILSVQPGPRVKKEQNSLCSGGRTGKNTPKVLQRKKKKREARTKMLSSHTQLACSLLECNTQEKQGTKMCFWEGFESILSRVFCYASTELEITITQYSLFRCLYCTEMAYDWQIEPTLNSL